jgi:hypothetical protein
MGRRSSVTVTVDPASEPIWPATAWSRCWVASLPLSAAPGGVDGMLWARDSHHPDTTNTAAGAIRAERAA